jgi:hypothetical protein
MSSDSDTPLADGQRFDIRPLLAATARRLEMELKNWPTKEAFDLARLLLADLDLRMETGDSREIAMARVIRDHSLLEPVSCPACGTDTTREED